MREAGPGYIEETHPAITVASHDWSVRIDPEASGEAVLVSETAGSNLTLAFRGSEVFLVAWCGPQGGQLLVTVDGEDADDLPSDPHGRSYIELYAPERTQKSFLVVKGANARLQTLRLTVSEFTHPDAGGRQCTIDAFQVVQDSDRRFPLAPVLILLAGSTAVGWFLGRSTIRRRPEEISV
jgi:hypothetical protein